MRGGIIVSFDRYHSCPKDLDEKMWKNFEREVHNKMIDQAVMALIERFNLVPTMKVGDFGINKAGVIEAIDDSEAEADDRTAKFVNIVEDEEAI